MTDGQPLIIGQINTTGSETRLVQDVSADFIATIRGMNNRVGSTGTGVRGDSYGGNGVAGYSNGNGVYGNSGGSHGVHGIGPHGVHGEGLVGVYGETLNAGGFGVFGKGATGGFAAIFDGHMSVINGNKHFQIDHPLDPENKYLLHTCVESSEMKNVYDGVARLDEDGAAWVELPEWCEALNGDFRYQLTAVGGSAPRLHVAEEISENRFKIAGGEEGIKVCWQVTGSRRDRWAAANPFKVEQEKREDERGRYLEPSVYDAPEEQRVMLGAIAETPRDATPSPTAEETVKEPESKS
jgi:hypothetical protein